ncbi:hypothetical protein MQA28_26120, partial [Escherichia coli]|nr:hypothetical protein [Escherichia coli]
LSISLSKVYFTGVFSAVKVLPTNSSLVERSSILNMKLFILSAIIFAVSAQETTVNPVLSAIIADLTAVFNAIDSDNDDNLVNSEQVQYYNSVDSNHDNCLDFEEFSQSREDLTDSQEDILRATYLFYDEVGGTEPANDCVTHRDMLDLFGLLDLNDDGDVSVNEFRTGNFLIATAIYEALVAIQSATPDGK